MVRSVIYAAFSDEASLLNAAQKLKKSGHSIIDAYTPFPVHGLDSVIGEHRSRIPIVCFISASIGCLFSMWFQIWTSLQSWPINVGGKPFASIPAFIPVTFEVTVLLGGLISVLAFFFRSRLFPGKKCMAPDSSVTNNGFWIAVEYKAAKVDLSVLYSALENLGGSRIRHEETEL